jgi:ElaB/YqjD/DUF883 family membrane-anchored ribosome-binding protein
MHSVADSVKQNPLPVLVIGAGVAWMIYASRRDKRSGGYDVEEYARYRVERDPDAYLDQPLDYPTGAEFEAGDQGGSKLGEMKDKVAEKTAAARDTVKNKLAHAGEAAKEKLSRAGEAAKEKVDALRERAGEVTSRVRDKTKEAYEHTRDRVVETADQHPLEVGLIALAAGLIAGLALPTPAPVNRTVGPAADRLRQRTREAGAEVVRKGRRVAEAAVSAVKEEAEAQGLTPERLREKAGAVAERAKQAGTEAADREGLNPANERNQQNRDTQPGAACPTPSDPSTARPAV